MSREFAMFVSGPLPGQNELISAAKGFGGRGFGYAKLKREWTEKVAWAARAARIPPLARASFTFRWVERNQKRDPDNLAGGGRKMFFDGLVVAGVLENDGWKQIGGWSDRFEVGPSPGVHVTIREEAPCSQRQ